MQAFPTDPEAARVAAIAFRSLGRLNEAADAARKWRDRSADHPQPADLLLAEIHLAQGDAAAAVKQLAPYAQQLKSDPAANFSALAILLRAQARAGQEKDAQAILEPLLSRQSAARILWLQLAGEEITNPETAAAWVRQVAPLMLPESREQLALAGAWYSLAVKHQVDGAAEQAAKALDPILARPDAPAEAFFLRGGLADRAGDAKTAEAHYRRGLELKADSPEALNNLAYLILQRGGDLTEAHTLASKAVALSPATPGFHDTLGRILARQRKTDAAVESFNQALRLDPNYLEALIGLATTLSESGKRDRAANVMSHIDVLLQSRPPLSAHLRRELDTLRATIKASL